MPNACATASRPSPAARSINSASKPSNPPSASSKRCSGFDASPYAVWPKLRSNGTWCASPTTANASPASAPSTTRPDPARRSAQRLLRSPLLNKTFSACFFSQLIFHPTPDSEISKSDGMLMGQFYASVDRRQNAELVARLRDGGITWSAGDTSSGEQGERSTGG